jgi:hypothetical protein
LFWDWIIRLVLPALEMVLGAVICDIFYGTHGPTRLIDDVALGLLVVVMLGLLVWWLLAWLPPQEGGLAASEPPTARAGGDRRTSMAGR